MRKDKDKGVELEPVESKPPIWRTVYAMTRDQLEKCRGILEANGISLVGDEGEITHSLPIGHAKIHLKYEGFHLVVSLLECPHIERASVESRIEQWLDKAVEDGRSPDIPVPDQPT